VNFPQYDLMSYVPSKPLAAYSPAPKSKLGGTTADYLNMLPPMDIAELQVELGYLLGSVHYTQLGQYGDHCFFDQRVTEPLKSFQRQISNIGPTIQQRNHHRRSYNFLLPSGVPQSINI
jgi:arachidonate 15-lipoxygenase